MIAPATSYRPARATAPAPRPAAPVSSEPVKELLDLSTIDTAAEAAQLPLLEPAFQLALTSAVVHSLRNSSAERQELCVVNKFAGTKLDTLFTLDLEQPGAPLTATGTCNGVQVTGTASLGPTVTWSGQTGENAEFVEMGPSLDQNAVRLAGNFGTVPADLTFEAVMDGGILAGVNTRGTLGGYEYLCETRVAGGTVTAQGHVGELEINKNYTLTTSDRIWTMEGSGINAGVEQNVCVTVSV